MNTREEISHIDTTVETADVLLEAVRDSASFRDLLELAARGNSVTVSDLPGSLCSVVIAAICGRSNVMVVAPNSRRSETLLDDLYLLLGENDVCFLPPGSNSRLRRLSPEAAEHNRAEALRKLAKHPPKCLVVLPDTLIERFPSLKSLKAGVINLEVGSESTPQGLLCVLMNAGFRREVQVWGCGEAALRGGILDFFPFGFKNPLRVEFWGDEIISLREFDPRTQRSIKNIDSVELFLTKPHLPTETVFQLSDGIVFWDDMDRITDRYRRLAGDDSSPLDLAPESLNSLIHLPLGGGEVRFGGSAADIFLGSEEDFLVKAARLLKDGYRVMLGSETDFRRERLVDTVLESEDETLNRLKIGVLPLQQGFVYPGGRLAFYTERELYDRPRPRRSFARFRTYSRPIELEELRVGDFVVHEDYGVGEFQGLKSIKVAGHKRECLQIMYRKGVRLYVRLEAFAKVQKYSGREGFVPALSKIGGSDWNRIRSRAKNAMMEMARELIKLQAKREVKEGFSFERDDVWQRQMEDAFVHQDTPDQSRAALEVKKDMEQGRPMDRLLLADVGFGKTEVAVRAAFKAVQSDRQVALLAPTTILVQQHLQTFRERMKEYPVVVESLSRFRTPKEQREIVKGLQDGTVDIVIGTHRLLSGDVSFRRLGLVIIDEEHRFGVRHKERLKHLREEVDVLTLTATPIPRTLRMALAGTRDISRIETPPDDRLPIVTEIVPFDKGVIREAIMYELNRRGQVFFVHNRIRSIESIQRMLSRIVPEARYGIAHGQMNSKYLEKVMFDFMERRFDVLVSTMIVESGIDLPNVNTMVVNRADYFGLAQLYQLRGRIGRSDRQAYAYLLIPPKAVLAGEARSRLETIGQFTELGSGFQVALRDLEIRGAGNLLGAQQSGFINSVGYGLYSKILEEAMVGARAEMGVGEPSPECKSKNAVEEVKIDFAGDAHIPSEYILDQNLRVNFYRRLSESGTIDDLEKLELEMIDRFGRIPSELKNLFYLLRLKLYAGRAGVAAISVKPEFLKLEFGERKGGYRKLIERAVLVSGDNAIEFESNPHFTIMLKFGLGGEAGEHFKAAEDFIKAL
ncbi:MAG: transcription-repair coupling factor [candidate division Zixibacteria bacterium]|nr:transcription-repair coupling factor [Candidatus Tariuqbacter arcticus]